MNKKQASSRKSVYSIMSFTTSWKAYQAILCFMNIYSWSIKTCSGVMHANLGDRAGSLIFLNRRAGKGLRISDSLVMPFLTS